MLTTETASPTPKKKRPTTGKKKPTARRSRVSTANGAAKPVAKRARNKTSRNGALPHVSKLVRRYGKGAVARAVANIGTYEKAKVRIGAIRKEIKSLQRVVA